VKFDFNGSAPQGSTASALRPTALTNVATKKVFQLNFMEIVVQEFVYYVMKGLSPAIGQEIFAVLIWFQEWLT